VSLAGFAARARLEEPVILRFFGAMKNKNYSIKARYDYYYAEAHPHHRCNRAMAEKALIEVNRLVKIPQYSQSVLWPKAELLKGLGQYAPAVKAYKAANKQPDSTWRVVDCQIAMKQYSNAIKSAKGLESVGGRVASSACLKVADIYRISGNKGKEIEQLRVVLRRYPKSGESSHAHQRLEGYGAKVTGGRSKADE
jgi:tetratricopeptide (TPR) repeat protein